MPPPSAATQIVGEPRLELTYSGTGTPAATHVFAQLVDEARGVVVGNQATPIPVTLDGQPHTITRPLEAIAASAPAGAKYTLQLTGGTLLYGPVRAAGAITFSPIKLTLPTAGAPADQRRRGRPRPDAHCLSRRRFSIRVRGAHPKVTVAGKRVKVRKGRAIVDLRGKPKGTIKVKVSVRRSGKTVRETRTYRTCTREAQAAGDVRPARARCRARSTAVMTMRPAPSAGYAPRSRRRRGPLTDASRTATAGTGTRPWFGHVRDLVQVPRNG